MTPLATALQKLKKNQGKLAASQLSNAQRKALDEYIRHYPCIQAFRQGRGMHYQVIEGYMFNRALEQHTGKTLTDQQLQLDNRTQNLLRYSHSKQGASQLEPHYIIMKSAGDSCVWQQGQDCLDQRQPNQSYAAANKKQQSIDLAPLTKLCGCASLMICEQDDWYFSGELWLVENQAVFDSLGWLPASASQQCVLLYGGMLSNKLINWLSHQERAKTIVLFSDYDGVGIENYCRLYDALHPEQNPQFWLMPNYLQLLRRLGNKKIWRDNRAKIDTRLTHAAVQQNPELASLLQNMIELGLALEQEAVLV